jgi:glyoxylase-like metal-dependent hydrolase (beta-lactamase superfamily II)
MPTVTLAPNVHWVGAKDPDLAVFDIVIPTEYGTTYNAYLVRGSEKTALIDCVKRPFAGELFRNISEFLPVEKLDYVVINHSEPDHAGALVDLLERHPKVMVLLSRSAKTFVVTSSTRVFYGSSTTAKSLRAQQVHLFVPPPAGLHLTYLVEDRILFPCDFLGAHFNPEFYNDASAAGDREEGVRILLRHHHAALQGARPQGVRAAEELPRRDDRSVAWADPAEGPPIVYRLVRGAGLHPFPRQGENGGDRLRFRVRQHRGDGREGGGGRARGGAHPRTDERRGSSDGQDHRRAEVSGFSSGLHAQQQRPSRSSN